MLPSGDRLPPFDSGHAGRGMAFARTMTAVPVGPALVARVAA